MDWGNDSHLLRENIWMFDVRDFQDRRHTQHCGMFTGIQQTMFWEKGPWESWKFEDLVLAPAHRVIHDAWARRWQEITLTFACNQGVHRSVSAAELTAAMLWGVHNAFVVEIRHQALARFDPPRCACRACNRWTRSEGDEAKLLWFSKK